MAEVLAWRPRGEDGTMESEAPPPSSTVPARGLPHAAHTVVPLRRMTAATAWQWGQRFASPNTRPQPGQRSAPSGTAVSQVGQRSGEATSDLQSITTPVASMESADAVAEAPSDSRCARASGESSVSATRPCMVARRPAESRGRKKL